MYRKMVNKTFQEESEETLQVKMDDMIVKSSDKDLYKHHLNRVFQRVRQYNMWLTQRIEPSRLMFSIKSTYFVYRIHKRLVQY